jgi:hypothetical protein
MLRIFSPWKIRQLRKMWYNCVVLMYWSCLVGLWFCCNSRVDAQFVFSQDLQEKFDVLSEQCRKYRKQIKLLAKKLKDAGGKVKAVSCVTLWSTASGLHMVVISWDQSNCHKRWNPLSVQNVCLFTRTYIVPEAHSGAVVEALRYKPEGRGIDSWCCH